MSEAVHPPAAQAAIDAAAAGDRTHAYALVGPPGSGKRAAARALAAELLADGSEDPARARERALASPSPHPDLVWIEPPGTQHLVEEIRLRVIGEVSMRPFEGGRRVFVIDAADAMAEESQNALLKTLEEPPSYAHLILISADPDGLLETVRSRCRAIELHSPGIAAAERRLAERSDAPPERIAAVAALAGGNPDLAELLASEIGSRLRGVVEASVSAAVRGPLAERPWKELIDLAKDHGAERAEELERRAAERASSLGEGREAKRITSDAAKAAKRADRKARTGLIDLALSLCHSLALDLAALAADPGAPLRNGDRRRALGELAAGCPEAAALELAAAAGEARRRLRVNTNEDLTLDMVFHRTAARVGARAPVG